MLLVLFSNTINCWKLTFNNIFDSNLTVKGFSYNNGVDVITSTIIPSDAIYFAFNKFTTSVPNIKVQNYGISKIVTDVDKINTTFGSLQTNVRY